MKKLAPNIVTFPNGRPVAVGRPSKPELAVRLAKEAVGKNDPDLFKRVEKLCGPYTFVGYLSKQTRGGDATAVRSDLFTNTFEAPVIVDHEGKEIGPCQPGDSFIEISDDAPFVEGFEEVPPEGEAS